MKRIAIAILFAVFAFPALAADTAAPAFHLDWAVIFGFLWTFSEVLSMIPKVKSNGTFQLVVNILRHIGADTGGTASTATFRQQCEQPSQPRREGE